MVLAKRSASKAPAAMGGLARAVRRAGHRVAEVNRADRRLRRAAGKFDTIDAEAAARSVLSGQATATPKTADGAVEMMRQLKIARDTAVKARTTAMITLKQIVVTASPVLRETLQDLTDHALLTRCAGYRPGPLDTPTASAKHTLRRAAPDTDRVPSTRPPRPPNTPSERSPAAGSPSPRKSPCTTVTSTDSRPTRRPPSVRASGSAPAPRLRCSSSSAITPTGFALKPLSRSSAARVQSRPRPA